MFGGVSFLGHEGLISEGGSPEEVPGAGTPPAAGLGPPAAGTRPSSWGGPPRGLPTPSLFRPKNAFYIFFLEFSANFLTLHSRKTPNAILLKTASVRVSSKQIT